MDGSGVTSVSLVVHSVCVAIITTLHCEDILVFCNELLHFIRNITLPVTSVAPLTHSSSNLISDLWNLPLYLCFLAGVLLDEILHFFPYPLPIICAAPDHPPPIPSRIPTVGVTWHHMMNFITKNSFAFELYIFYKFVCKLIPYKLFIEA